VQHLHVDRIRAVAVRDHEAPHGAVLARLLVAHELQELCRRTIVAEPHGGRVEPADRDILAHAVPRPRCAVVLALDQGEAVTIGAAEQEPVLSEAIVALHAVHLEGRETVGPGVERALRHGKRGRADLAHAGAAAGGVGEGEIGHHRPRRADLVRVVEVIDVRRIEVHRLLDAAEAQHLREEGVVLPRARGQRGDVMEALDLVQHGKSPVRVSVGPKIVRAGFPVIAQIRAKSARLCT
jgi:hypothetical protein